MRDKDQLVCGDAGMRECMKNKSGNGSGKVEGIDISRSKVPKLALSFLFIMQWYNTHQVGSSVC